MKWIEAVPMPSEESLSTGQNELPEGIQTPKDTMAEISVDYGH